MCDGTTSTFVTCSLGVPCWCWDPYVRPKSIASFVLCASPLTVDPDDHAEKPLQIKGNDFCTYPALDAEGVLGGVLCDRSQL